MTRWNRIELDSSFRELNMTTLKANRLARGIAILAILWAGPLYAQLEIGTWVRTPTKAMPDSMTMKIEACCGSGRRLSYSFGVGNQAMVMFVETKLDGSEAPVLINGKPSGETMAITRVDAHHASTILRMNGKEFATSKATLSADGRTLTVINDCESTAACMPIGKSTETWVKQ
jgi:hypothetical protein